jgi:hypothetical protein
MIARLSNSFASLAPSFRAVQMMKYLWIIVFLLICSGCATFSDRSTFDTQKDPWNAYYPVPDCHEPGNINGRPHVVSPMQTVEEGVYYFDAGLSRLVLELSNGRYRFWFSSDGRSLHAPKYPLTGEYSAQGPTVRLLHKGEDPNEDIWTFRKIDGATTLWRPNAVKAWHEEKRFDRYGVLYKSDRPGNETWVNRDFRMAP